MSRVLIGAVRLYQLFISPMLPANSCWFYPSCSHYAIEALREYGVVKGTWMSVRRIAKCHPFHAGGYDPVR